MDGEKRKQQRSEDNERMVEERARMHEEKARGAYEQRHNVKWQGREKCCQRLEEYENNLLNPYLVYLQLNIIIEESNF